MIQSPNFVHGHTWLEGSTKTKTVRSRTYYAWGNMRKRCRGQTNARDYADRGITCDPRWSTFSAFLSDMGECPPGLTLERINNDGNYTKENCRWADLFVQANNKRNNVFYEFQGKRMTLPQWSRELGIERLTLWQRLNRYGYPIEVAFTVQGNLRGSEHSLRREP